MRYLTSIYTIFSLIILTTTACAPLWGNDSYLHRRQNAYLTSQNGTSLQLPPHLRKNCTLNQRYTIPNVTGQAGISLAPPGSSIAQHAPKQVFMPGLKKSQLRLQTVHRQPVLIVDIPYTEAWLAVNNSLARQRIPVIGQNRQSGYYYIVDTYATKNRVTKA